MTAQWRSLADLAKRIEGDRHEVGRGFLEMADRQVKRGTISKDDATLIRKHYARQSLQDISTEEYVRLRQIDGNEQARARGALGYSDLEQKFFLTPEETARAEAALRKASVADIGELHESGFVETGAARTLLSMFTEIDPATDTETAIGKAVKAAEAGKLAPPFDEAAFRRDLASAGIDVSRLSEEHLEKYGGDLPNLARVSRGQAPRVRANGETPDEPDAQFVARLGRMIQHNAEQSAKPGSKSANTPEMPTDGRGVMSAAEAAQQSAAENS